MTRPASFLGTGWGFPPRFSRGGAEVEMVSDVEDVHQSLRILLATRRGERPMQESFGCNLDDEMFEEVDQGLVNRVSSLVYDAILEHEPRVDLFGVDLTAGADGVLLVRIDYAVRGTNSRFNMVLPFFPNEAVAPGL
jgi:phage baseplate assembly protein W